MPKLVWVDLEMTGLDINKERIIEIACIITDMDLKIIEEYGPVIVKQSDQLLDNMDQWNTDHHGKSGLTEAVRRSDISEQQAEIEFLAFIKKHVPKVRDGYLAGNSIGQDKKFLDKYMPSITDHLHYRVVDVSTIKTLVENWYQGKRELSRRPTKGCGHRALDDIRESLEELQYYRSAFFKDPKELKDCSLM